MRLGGPGVLLWAQETCHIGSLFLIRASGKLPDDVASAVYDQIVTAVCVS